MKRDATKQEWEETTPAGRAVEGQARQSTIEAGAAPSASQTQSQPQPQSQAEQDKEPAALQSGQAEQKASQA